MMRSAGARAWVFVRSLALVGLIVVAIPWGLTAAAEARFGGRTPWHGVPPPADWELARIRGALTDRLTDQTIADIVIRISLAVAWIAVVVLVATIIVELAHMMRHGGLAMPDVRGLGLSQSLARVVASGLLVVMPAIVGPGRAVARDGAPLVPVPREGTVEVADVAAFAPATRPENVRSPGAPPAPTDLAGPPAGADPTRLAPPPGPATAPERYVVRAGDSIYGIAERLVGPDTAAVASYADRLLELNLGTVMPDGQRFDNAAYIDVGWVLELPDAPAASDAWPAVVHVVEPGESLWTIAEDELGDPHRWPELYEANEGRRFDDGRSLHDPDLIHPGWELAVPGDAPVEPVAPADGASDATDALAGPPAGALPELVPDPERSVAPLDVAAGDHAARPDNVWESEVGSVDDPSNPSPDVAAASLPAPSPAERVTSRLGAVPAPEVIGPDGRPVGRDVGDRPATDASIDGREVPPLLTFGRAAMLSAGVLTLLGARRRQRLRRAATRTRLPSPEAGPATTERALRAIDAGERFARVDVGIRAAALPLVEQGQRVVVVLAASDGDLELVASGDVALPPPWAGGGSRWRLPASVPIELLADAARRVGAPCPTLVQLGHDDRERDVYVDLEAIEAIEIGGPADVADSIVTAVAATLAGSVLAEVTTLVGLGVPDEAFLGHRLHVPARDVPHAFATAAEAIGTTASRAASTFELRARVTSGETWEPAVVLAGSASGTVTLPTNRTGLAVVSAAPIHGPSSRLAPEGDGWVLRPAGVRLTPVGLAAGDLGAIVALVDVAGPVPTEVAADLDADQTLAPPDDLSAPPVGARSFPAEPEPGFVPPARPWSLLVRLLGPVEVVDAGGESIRFERSKTRELIAWLATHRDRSTRSAARTALWELDVRDATFANVVSEARRSLARLVEPPDGEEWVARTMTDALPLHELVRTDAELLEHALDAARLQPPAQAIATLAPAVELIIGMPFEGTSYLWPDSEGLTSDLVLLATSAASELAAHCLSVGDIDGVFGATGRGLRVLPGHEELIGLRMRAHATAGDHAGVRHEWESYERVINGDPWSDGEPAPKLVELRRRLLRPTH